MKNVIKLFSTYPKDVAKHYLVKAKHIETQLANGVSYQKLNGCHLILCPDLIRFKFGRYRLIFKRDSNGYTPLSLIKRKNLELFLKRRCS